MKTHHAVIAATSGRPGIVLEQTHLAECVEESKGGIFEKDARAPEDSPHKLLRVASLGWLGKEAGQACQDVAAKGNWCAQQGYLTQNLMHLSNGLRKVSCRDSVPPHWQLPRPAMGIA